MIRHGKTGTAFIGLRFLLRRADVRRFLLPVLSLAAFALFGCATGSEMETTKSNLAQLQVQSAGRDREIAQLKEQMTTIQKDLNSFTAIKESQSNLLSQTSDYSKDLQSLRGRFDENKYFMDKTIKDLTSEIELQKARVTALENQLKEGKGQSATDTKETAKPSVSSINGSPATNTEVEQKGPDSAAKLYDEAHIALKQKRYADARKMFERFVKDYPKESLTPNSYFWIGETYYANKKYEDAILAYEDYLKKYPKHEKVKGAMLKQGYSFLELGDRKTGKVILETLIEKYPKSNEADLARKKLKELASAKTPSPKTKKK
jgi:tol-pal system protein YbgF